MADTDPYEAIARRLPDDALARLRQEHQAAEDRAQELMLMHSRIVTAIIGEQSRRIVPRVVHEDYCNYPDCTCAKVAVE